MCGGKNRSLNAIKTGIATMMFDKKEKVGLAMMAFAVYYVTISALSIIATSTFYRSEDIGPTFRHGKICNVAFWQQLEAIIQSGGTT